MGFSPAVPAGDPRKKCLVHSGCLGLLPLNEISFKELSKFKSRKRSTVEDLQFSNFKI